MARPAPSRPTITGDICRRPSRRQVARTAFFFSRRNCCATAISIGVPSRRDRSCRYVRSRQYTRRVPVLLAALGMLIVSLDSAVNVALPAMAGAFAIGPTEIRWVIICYVLTYAITSVAAGVLADRLGPVRVYAIGMWLSV